MGKQFSRPTSPSPNYGQNVVVLGAGVLGLTTALQLARAGFKNVLVVARHMPGDNHPDYSSIWAGVNYMPVSKPGTEEAQWDVEAWHELTKLAKNVPAAGVWIQNKTSYYRNQDKTPDQLNDWFKGLVYDYKLLSKDEVPAFADWGVFCRTIALDPSIYLHYLQSKCLELGVRFRRASVAHIRDAFSVRFGDQPADQTVAEVVVNCTGTLAARLGGVEDEAMVPMRGQLVVVENESVGGMFSVSGDDNMHEEVGECCYIINRPSGGGTVLGGSYYPTWSQEPDMELAKRIMERSVRICPSLVEPGAGVEGLRVVRHQVGLRPVRKGGVRIEAETLSSTTKAAPLRVVHCYGAGGFGFQSSYGMANKAVRLVRESVAPRTAAS